MKGREKMRFIVCGDALFSSRNLAKRLDKTLVERLQNADGGFVNAEFCTPEPTTPPACGRGCMTSVRPATLSECRSESEDGRICQQPHG